MRLPRKDKEQRDGKYDTDGAAAGAPAHRAAVHPGDCSGDGEEHDAVCFCDPAL